MYVRACRLISFFFEQVSSEGCEVIIHQKVIISFKMSDQKNLISKAIGQVLIRFEKDSQ